MLLWDLGFVMRPIDAWPGERTKQEARSPFKGNWINTKIVLARELKHLGSKGARSSLVAMKQSDLRVDGSGYLKGARVEHYGVVLAFDSRYGPLKYACDRFSSWEANVRAIALGLEALRKVERYGISRRGEQYQGYRQLPGTVAEMTPEIAFNVIARFSGIPAASLQADADVLGMAYKLAAKRTHPDAGGNAEDFKALQQAKAVVMKAEAVAP